MTPDTRFQLGDNADAVHHPLWAPGGTRLLYFANTLGMSVDVRTEPGVAFGRPVPVDTLPINVTPQTQLNHDISPDGTRVVTIVPISRGDAVQPPDQIIAVLNWFDELERLVPTR